MDELRVRRLSRGDVAVARDLFAMMVDVFAEHAEEGVLEPLRDDYVLRLLDQDTFWPSPHSSAPILSEA